MFARFLEITQFQQHPLLEGDTIVVLGQQIVSRLVGVLGGGFDIGFDPHGVGVIGAIGNVFDVAVQIVDVAIAGELLGASAIDLVQGQTISHDDEGPIAFGGFLGDIDADQVEVKVEVALVKSGPLSLFVEVVGTGDSRGFTENLPKKLPDAIRDFALTRKQKLDLLTSQIADNRLNDRHH